MFGIQKLNASTNVLLAKHSLDYTELVPANPICQRIRDAIVSDLRVEFGSSLSDVMLELMFNGWSSFKQLLFVAEAFRRVSVPPLLTPEVWCRVKDVLDPALESEKHQRAVQQRLRNSYGLSVELTDCRLFLGEQGIFDEPLPQEPGIDLMHTYLLAVLEASIREPEKAYLILQAEGGLAMSAKLLLTQVQLCVHMYYGQARRFSSYRAFSDAMALGDEKFIAPAFKPGTTIAPEVRNWAAYIAWSGFRQGLGENHFRAFVDPYIRSWQSASESKLSELEQLFVARARS